jgi:hypothetical protein
MEFYLGVVGLLRGVTNATACSSSSLNVLKSPVPDGVALGVMSLASFALSLSRSFVTSRSLDFNAANSS